MTSIITELESLKLNAERSIKQIKNENDLLWLPDGESNSIAILIKHITGNMNSRWTDFLTSDGEKQNRNRPTEFDQKMEFNKEELMNFWNNSWELLFGVLNNLSSKDLTRTVKIRDEPLSVPKAIIRQLAHYSVHIGQIIFLAKHLEWKDWNSLSIPRAK